MAVIGGINLGNLVDYLFFFANGSEDANWQGASKGYVGNVAVNGEVAQERTSGFVPYAGTIFTNDVTLGPWQQIVNDNPTQASEALNQDALIAGLQADLTNAFNQINSLPATPGFESVNSLDLNGLDFTNGVNETIVINVTSGFNISSKININGDPGDVIVLRWDEDLATPGYQGEVKFQSGGAIVPGPNLKPTNFINVAGDIGSSGGGTNPPPPYPQCPCFNDGQGPIIVGGQPFNGGGFFTGYWLTTGDPSSGQTGSMSNAIFVGGWYTTTNNFSLTSGSSGVYITPNPATEVTPGIHLVKLISVDNGVTFVDANTPPFPVLFPPNNPIFQYVLTNTGNVTLDNVALADTQFGQIVLPVTTLAPGASTQVTVTGTFAPGENCNSATATGTGNNQTVTSTDIACYFGAVEPSINVAKLVSVNNGVTFEEANTPPGAILISPTNPIYQFVVTNTGPVTITDITLVDTTFGPVAVPTTTLAPGASFTVELTGTFAFGEHCNTATVNGLSGGTPVADADTACITGVSGAEIGLLKFISVDNGTTFVDAHNPPFPVLTAPTNPLYQFLVTNLGTVTLTGVSLMDTTFGPIVLPGTTLAPGESFTVTLPGTFALGENCNTAIASGTGDAGAVTATDFACFVGVEQPAIAIVKLVSVDNGGTFVHTPPNPNLNAPSNPQFQYTVTNTGAVTLHSVTVVDSDLGPIAIPTTTLAPGQSTTVTVTGTFAAGLQCNDATATGTSPGGAIVTGTDTACYVGVEQPAITIIKRVSVDNGTSFVHTPPNPNLNAPTNPQFQYTVTNSGPVTLNNVIVVDSNLGPIAIPETTLAPGQSTTVTVTGTFAPGLQCNDVTATGTSPAGQTVTGTDAACYVGIEQGPGIQIIKEVSPDGGMTWLDANTPPGAQIPLSQQPMFRYTVTNIGNVTLSGVSVSDNVLGQISVGGILLPGESAVFIATGTWLVGTHCNTARAIGTFDGITVSDTDTACFTGTSVPIFPPLPPPIPQPQIIDYLLETVAFEELALAALVNAEAEKIQAVAAAGILGPVEPGALEAINRSVSDVINQAANKEQLLSLKLARILAHKQRT